MKKTGITNSPKPQKGNLRKITYEFISLFMQNKPNFRNDIMDITIDMTTYYKILSRWLGQKTKPIQTQFNPIQTQFLFFIVAKPEKRTLYTENTETK